jgi:phosphoribosylamine--glycine ligase
MKILVVGGGGREHALAWKLRQSPSVTDLYAAPGNAGIAAAADCVPIDASSTVEIADFAEKVHVDLTIVGPEVPLTLGITAEFEKRGLRIFGASREAAEIESSKVFAKEFMARHGVPTAGFVSCASFEEAASLLKKRPKSDFPVVLKADGLAAGKGVIIAENASDAEGAAADIMKRRKFGTAGDRLVVEDFLRGVEVSFFALSDGEFVLPLVTCQDYKRIGDANRGPNTGGMGAFSPSVHVSQEVFEQVVEEVFVPVIRGMDQEGRTYRGVLYAGVMLTEQGPKVLEFNARFGDPEAQVLLPRLRSDLGELLLAATEKRLEKIEVEWSRERTVCVVMASEGYPGSYKTGHPIEGLEKASARRGVTVFHAGTLRDQEGRLRTAGGRVLSVMAQAGSFEEARAEAYAAAESLHFQGRYFRKDIAQEAVAFEHKAHAGTAAVRTTRGGRG